MQPLPTAAMSSVSQVAVSDNPLPPCSGCLVDWCHSGCVGAQIEFPLGFRAVDRSIFGWKQYRLCLKLIFSYIDCHANVVTLMYALDGMLMLCFHGDTFLRVYMLPCLVVSR